MQRSWGSEASSLSQRTRSVWSIDEVTIGRTKFWSQNSNSWLLWWEQGLGTNQKDSAELLGDRERLCIQRIQVINYMKSWGCGSAGKHCLLCKCEKLNSISRTHGRHELNMPGIVMRLCSQCWGGVRRRVLCTIWPGNLAYLVRPWGWWHYWEWRMKFVHQQLYPCMSHTHTLHKSICTCQNFIKLYLQTFLLLVMCTSVSVCGCVGACGSQWHQILLE